MYKMNKCCVRSHLGEAHLLLGLCLLDKVGVCTRTRDKPESRVGISFQGCRFESPTFLCGQSLPVAYDTPSSD